MEPLLWVGVAILILAVAIVWLEARRITRRRQAKRTAELHWPPIPKPLPPPPSPPPKPLAVDEPLSPGCAVCERDAREVRH